MLSMRLRHPLGMSQERSNIHLHRSTLQQPPRIRDAQYLDFLEGQSLSLHFLPKHSLAEEGVQD